MRYTPRNPESMEYYLKNHQILRPLVDDFEARKKLLREKDFIMVLLYRNVYLNVTVLIRKHCAMVIVLNEC